MPSQPVTVTISLKNGQLSVNPDPFVVHKHKDQMVMWECEPGPQFNFTVEFENGSPFYESQFSEHFPCSGVVRRNVLPDRSKPSRYKYTVRVENATPLDPGGEVDR